MGIAQFEKVSFGQFAEGVAKAFGAVPEEKCRQLYAGISLPKRATRGSAGYDLYTPADVTIEPGQSVLIPTGLRVRMNEGWVLLIFPRSGLGMRYRLQLNNTVGVIDSDYCFAKNEGHIFVPLTNDSKEGKTCVIRAGEGFAQGVFVPFGVTEDDAVTEVRVGGFGSTTK